MMRQKQLLILCAVMLSGAWVSKAAAKEVTLQNGWEVQSACKTKETGATISSMEYRPSGWIAASVPSTVLAAQVTAGIYKDIYFGTNLRSIPGTTYPIGENFSKLPMAGDSPYNCGWWYRNEFDVAAKELGQRFHLQFDGINYSAEIWVNGKRIAGRSQVRGAYRTYDFDVTAEVHPNGKNVVAVEVFGPTEKNLGMNWVDWSPMPPDKNMGVWSTVRLVSEGAVAVRHSAVFTHFPDDTLQTALLTVVADLSNAGNSTAQGDLVAEVAGRRISQHVSIPAGQTTTVTLRPDDFPQLRFHQPRVWWPIDYGDHPLHTATVRLVVNGTISDEERISFGIREITSEFTQNGHRLFRINGKPILIRGGGWAPDMLLRSSSQRLSDEFAMVRDLHLNTIRLEGKMESDDFFRLADRDGILVLAGWCCCDFWEQWSDWSTDDLHIAAESLRSQMLRLRSHPSVLGWMYGSDNPPPAEVERRYQEVIAEAQWPDPVISSASATPTSTTAASGVKMSGPYDYVAPSYWYQETSKFGGAFGFNTETSPGAAPEQVTELKRFLPDSALWPPDNPVWDFHAGGEDFKNLDRFNQAMKETYGAVDNIDAYAQVAQTMTYDGERAMFEAYSGERYTSTGVIQWMLNNAWPSLFWHLYDYYLVPGGGYYGAKKANEPVHIQYDYERHAVVVVNSTLSDTYDMDASVEVFGSDLKMLFTKTINLDRVAANTAQTAIEIPSSAWVPGAQFYFVRLNLGKGGGVGVSHNFYWVPATPTVFDWAKTTYITTPPKEPEVMTGVRTLPAANLEAKADVEGDAVIVHAANHSKALAFQLAAEAYDEDGTLIPATLWNENYIELMPGEATVLSAVVPQAYRGHAITVRLSGWNTTTWEQKVTVSNKPSSR